ncbi:uncharacterized protein LOC136065433 [Quercus suber]|uniref:uncharacterized protein LOC136065433 n=1 Tax=Quercus suber TaxID=58331 RepID=UPI0032DFDCCF
MEDSSLGRGGASSDNNKVKQIWWRIWCMNIPNKIRNFAWRAWRDILPNKVNLRRRMITKDELCNECGGEPETNCHMFWFCEKAKEIWENSKLVFPFHIEPWWSFLDVVWKIMKCNASNSELLETTITICWEMWKNRNAVRNGGPRSTGKTIVKRASTLLQDYRAATEEIPPTRPSEAVKWHPPDHPFYKMNVDATVLKELQATGIGTVVRDGEGKVLAAMSKRVLAPLATLEAEAKSMEVAVQFAWEMGFRDIICETDSLSLYQALVGSTEAPTCIDTIVSSILLSIQHFCCISFSHVKRQGNRPAHILAQFTRHVRDFVVWLEETLSLIEHACA